MQQSLSMLAKSVSLGESLAQWILFWLTSTQVARFLGEPFFWVLGQRRKRQEIDLSKIKRILIVRLDEIGDLVLTTPFLRELRRNLPDAWITLVVKPNVYNLMELCPYADEVLTYDWNTLLPSDSNSQRCFWQVQQHRRALELAWKHFRRRRFDLAILPRWDADLYNATFVAYFSGAPWRVGYSEHVIDDKRRLNEGYDRLLTHVLSDHTLKHEVERNLCIIRFLGGRTEEEHLELWVNREDETFAEQLLNQHGVPRNQLLVAFAPGAREPKRMWPLENYIELGAWLTRERGAWIVVVGGKREKLLGKELKKQMGDTTINVVGLASLRQTSALLKRCRLCVSNDAGAMHLAAAAGVAIIEISCHPRNGSEFHSNSPKRFGPWGVPHIVLQPERAADLCSEGCDHNEAHCIVGVRLEHVKEAVVAQLSQQEGLGSLGKGLNNLVLAALQRRVCKNSVHTSC